MSNVFDVPIPMIGTIGASACFGESERVSMRHILAPAANAQASTAVVVPVDGARISRSGETTRTRPGGSGQRGLFVVGIGDWMRLP